MPHKSHIWSDDDKQRKKKLQSYLLASGALPIALRASRARGKRVTILMKGNKDIESVYYITLQSYFYIILTGSPQLALMSMAQ